MNTNIPLDRTKEVEEAKILSERSDLRQHADKMLRDFEKFNDFSSNRAIWELVQNACDLTTECEVVIDYRDNKFSFTHNGRAFNSNSLISLIKQVSGDKDENSEIPPVGKYGTGFLTTHSLGRKFILNSILQTSSGHFLELKDFPIDRSPKKWEELSDQIRIQKDKAFEIIDKTGKVVENPKLQTTFTYLPESDQEKKYVEESYRDIEDYVPIVLTINNRLKFVKIIAPTGQETDFCLLSKIEEPNEAGIKLYKTTIQKKEDQREIYSIADPEYQIEIILPINKDHDLFEFPERVAKLFLYYPLIGTESFGMNFIINCNQFLPTEQRDGIHLNSTKDQVKEQEETNRKLVEKATLLLFKFLSSNILTVSNPLLYASVNFKRNSENLLLNEYFNGLQEKWVEDFKELKIVETKLGPKKASEITFLHAELFEKEVYVECIYYLLDKFYEPIPSAKTIKEWSTYVKKWGLPTATFVGNEELVKKIEQGSLADFDESKLKKYYEYLLADKKTDLFTDHTLLPNLEGKFQLLNKLKRTKELPPQLIEIGKILIPEAITQLVDENFSFDIKFENYNRKDFSNTINTVLNEKCGDNRLCIPKEHKPEDYKTGVTTNTDNLEMNFFLAALRFCKLHSNINSQSKPTKLMEIISTYYYASPNLLQIDPLANKEEDLDVRQAQRNIARVFFNTLAQHSQEWIKNNTSTLYNIALCNEDRFKEIYTTSKIYPNQLYNLCHMTDLKKALDLNDYITDLYNRATGKLIEATVADIKFNEFLIENEEETNKNLGTRIEDIFFETDFRDINDHPFKEDILNIISKLNRPFFKDLFPRLDDKKANLMLDVVTNESTKDDIFSIVTLKEDQLKKLGKLVQLPNFEQILSQAETSVQSAKERQSDFAHKYKIGTYIEDKIREKLSEVIAAKIVIDKDHDLNTEDVQGGQDIIIYYDGTPLYFIEVKSRWDSNNSVSMSKLQLERASENIDKYSLISVDITKYEGVNDKYKLSLEEIIPLVKVIDSIGSNVHLLVSKNLAAERDLTSAVKLVDYRGIVNQDTINNGSDFQPFVDKLINYIRTNIPQAINEQAIEI